MITIAELIMFLMLLQCLWHIARTMVVNKKIKQNKNNAVSFKETRDEKPKFFIVIPCLQEQKIINRTIDDFVNIITSTKIDAKLFIVTTDKEKLLTNQGKTTFDIVKEKIDTSDSYKDIKLLNYPRVNGMMADQLNYAFDTIYKMYDIDEKSSYFCVYNADSRPGKDAFLQAKRVALKKHFPLIMQEYSAFFSNLNTLSPIMQGFAVYQTNFELINGLTNAILPSIFLRNHVVGHGLFVRFDYLKRIGGFNTEFWCEDIYLSFYLRSQGIIIEPLFALEYGESPKNIQILAKQNANWFKTLSDNKKIYQILSKNKDTKQLNTFLYYLNQVRGAFAWLLLPSFYLVIFIFLIFINSGLALVFTLVYLTTTFIRFWLSNSIAKNLHGKLPVNNFLLAFESSIAYLISNVGPLYLVFHRKGTKYKTER